MNARRALKTLNEESPVAAKLIKSFREHPHENVFMINDKYEFDMDDGRVHCYGGSSELPRFIVTIQSNHLAAINNLGVRLR